MAITETRTLPPEYVEALGKTYAADLTRQAGIPSITTATTQQPGETAEQFAQRQAQAQQFGITRAGMAELAPQVAAQDPLQTQAAQLAASGVGSFQPSSTSYLERVQCNCLQGTRKDVFESNLEWIVCLPCAGRSCVLLGAFDLVHHYANAWYRHR